MATARTALAALLLTGCPAERLGVPLPPRGLQAISQEDLQRDLFHLLEAGDAHRRHPEAPTWVAQRLEQMGLEPVPIDVHGANCGRREGRGDGQLLFLASTSSAGAELAALPDAALISLAKSTDGLGPPARELLFCSCPEDEFGGCWGALPAPSETVFLQGLAGDDLLIERLEWPTPAVAVSTSGSPTPVEQDGMERLNYVRIAEHLRRVHRELIAPELTPPG